MLFPLAPISSPQNIKKYEIRGGYNHWEHNTMDSETAKEHFLRCFKEVDVPILAYPEFLWNLNLPVPVLKKMQKEREMFVKKNSNKITESNVSQLYNTFLKIL